MRTPPAAAALVFGLAVTLVACGGGGSDAADSDRGSGSATTAPTSSDGGGDKGDSGGDVDCTEIDEAAKQLISIQLLAQLDDPTSIASIEANTIGALDIDEFLAGMETLHQLDGYSSPLGDPKEAIDTYEAAATKAQELFDADPPTQAAIDDYMESIGSTGEFLSHQTAIAGALDEAGC